MASGAQGDRNFYHSMNIPVPGWIFRQPLSEYKAMMISCERAAVNAFYKKLDEFERIHDKQLNAKIAGQMDIYDYD